jgi:hypothetical protein
MVLRHDSETLVGRIQRRTFGYGPGFENAVDLQAEIVVKASSGMPLDHESPAPLGFSARQARLSSRLRSVPELPFLAIFVKRHPEQIVQRR